MQLALAGRLQVRVRSCELSWQGPGADAAIVKQVLSYFMRNPKAADTLEGVARWRLLEEQIQNSIAQTEAALEWLVAQGLLEELPPRGSRRLFRLNAARHAEAIRLLEKKEKPGRKES
jgi:hypothetical protein